MHQYARSLTTARCTQLTCMKQEFLKGCCRLKSKCKKLHLYVCPEYHLEGRCAKGLVDVSSLLSDLCSATCKLKHVGPFKKAASKPGRSSIVPSLLRSKPKSKWTPPEKREWSETLTPVSDSSLKSLQLLQFGRSLHSRQGHSVKGQSYGPVSHQFQRQTSDFKNVTFNDHRAA